jgi:DNA polymerase-3 subunit beta
VLGSVINSSNTLPILDNFLFELDNKTLTVSASDLETTMSATLEIDSTSKGSVAVPAKLLLDILKTFPEQPLTFTVEENSTIEISSNSGKYAIAYAPGEEFLSGRLNFRSYRCAQIGKICAYRCQSVSSG